MASAWHGYVVIVGAGDVKVTIDADLLLKKELVVRGNLVCSMTQYYQAVDFLKTHPVRLDDMITHRFRITEASEAFAVFDSGKTGKVMFEWDQQAVWVNPGRVVAARSRLPRGTSIR